MHSNLLGSQGYSRRSILAGLGLATMTGLAGCATTAASSATFFQRTGLPIGLQIYTLGEEAAKDIDATFATVAEIGYRTIEMPGLLGRTASEIRAAADRAGLAIGSLHVPLFAMGPGTGLMFGDEDARIADVLGTLGAKWAVAPIALFPETFQMPADGNMAAAIVSAFRQSGTDIWKRTASLLNQRAEALKPLGITVAYHNHNIEFMPIGDTSGWKIITGETDPSLVSFEIDLGWIATAGLDPVAFLNGIAGRVAMVHVKDVAATNKANYGMEMHPTEVGSGTLDWKKLLPAAYDAGARLFYIEQEPPFTMERIESARRGYQYLFSLKT
jgi:sugar phosphate isomerase/epimerase